MHEIIVTEIDGTKKLFPSLKSAGEFYGTTATAIRHRILGLVKNEPRKFEYTGKTCVNPQKKERSKKDEEDNTPCDNKNRKEIPYETLGSRVCITLCQHRKGVKVGSVRCQGCLRFHGIDRNKHIVICSS